MKYYIQPPFPMSELTDFGYCSPEAEPQSFQPAVFGSLAENSGSAAPQSMHRLMSVSILLALIQMQTPPGIQY